MITLGVQFGGPGEQQNNFDCLLRIVATTAANLRSPTYADGSEGWINPIFLVPGSILPSQDFDGIKLGHYSKKQRGLVLMIAVPASVRDAGDGRAFIESSLRQCVSLAAEHFQKKRDPFSFIAANQLIDKIMKNVGGMTPGIQEGELEREGYPA